MKKLFVLLAAALLTSCGSSSYYVNSPIEEKTVCITTGRLGMVNDLKNEFRKHGWQIYGSPQKTIEQENQEKAVAYIGNARYSLNWEYYKRDLSIRTWKPILDLNLSLVDNKTGLETISYEAIYMEQTEIFKEFMDLLEKNSKK